MVPGCGAHYPFLEIKQIEIFDDQLQRVQQSVTEFFIVDLRYLLRIFSFVLFYSSQLVLFVRRPAKGAALIFF